MTSRCELDDPYCLQPGEAARLLAGHPWRRFVVLGDSVASGEGDPVDGYPDLSWADRVAAELRTNAPRLDYRNLGEQDLTAAQVRHAQLAVAVAFRPDLAMVVCGANDALRSSYRPEAVDEQLCAIVAALQAAGADVITVGLFDTTYAPLIPARVKRVVGARMRRLSVHTAQLAQRLGTIHVNLTGHPIETDESMYSADGLHGNRRSHAICAAATVRRLGQFLGNAATGLLWRPQRPRRAAAPGLAAGPDPAPARTAAPRRPGG